MCDPHKGLGPQVQESCSRLYAPGDQKAPPQKQMLIQHADNTVSTMDSLNPAKTTFPKNMGKCFHTIYDLVLKSWPWERVNHQL